MSWLPPELFIQIFSQATLQDRGRYELVCKDFGLWVYQPSFQRPVSQLQASSVDTSVTYERTKCQWAARKQALRENLTNIYIFESAIPELSWVLPLLQNTPRLTHVTICLSDLSTLHVLRVLGLSNAPLFRINLNTTYQDDPDKHQATVVDQVDQAVFARLRPTLRELMLNGTFLSHTQSPEPLLRLIGDELGETLEVLSLTVNDFTLLTNKMKVLRELYIRDPKLKKYNNSEALDSSVGHQLRDVPPSVGLRLGVLDATAVFFNTLLLDALFKKDLKPIDQLLELGCDLYAPVYPLNFQRNHSHFSRSFYSRNIEVPRYLMESGKTGLWSFDTEPRGRSVFNLLYMANDSTGDAWSQCAAWLFSNKWADARKKFSQAELLHHDGTDVFQELVITKKPHLFKPRLDFALAHPEIFGERPFCVRSGLRANLFYFCSYKSDVTTLWAYREHVDWKERNEAGDNALEFLALRREGASNLAAMSIIELCSDDEFLQFVKPEIWPVVNATSNDEEPQPIHPVKAYNILMHRFFRLAPKDQWEDFIHHSIHTRMRWGKSKELVELLTSHGLEVRDITIRALLREYDAKRWRPYYGSIDDEQLFIRTGPHALVLIGTPLDLLNIIIPALKSHLGPSSFHTYITALDEKGRNCYQFAETRPDTWKSGAWNAKELTCLKALTFA